MFTSESPGTYQFLGTMSRVTDLMGVLKGVKKVVGALQKQVERQSSDAWLHSSIRDGIENASASSKTYKSPTEIGLEFVESIPKPLLDARLKMDEVGDKLFSALGSIKTTRETNDGPRRTRDTGQGRVDKEERLGQVKETLSKLQETVESASSSVSDLTDLMAKGDISSALKSFTNTVGKFAPQDFAPPVFNQDDVVDTADIPDYQPSAEPAVKPDSKASGLPDFSKLINSVKNDLFALDKSSDTLQQTAKTVGDEMNVIIENLAQQVKSSGILSENMLRGFEGLNVNPNIDIDIDSMGGNPGTDSAAVGAASVDKDILNTIDAIRKVQIDLQNSVEELQRSTDFVKDDMTSILDSIAKGDLSGASKIPLSRLKTEADIDELDFSDHNYAAGTGAYPTIHPDDIASSIVEDEEEPVVTQGNITNPFPDPPAFNNGMPPTRNYSTLSRRPTIYQMYLRRLSASSKPIKPPDGPILKQAASSYMKTKVEPIPGASLSAYNVSKKSQEANSKKRKRLDTRAKRKAVPDTQLKRIYAFSGLAASLGVSTLTEWAKSLVADPANEKKSILLSEKNMDIIVSKLCEVRGAALKMGQMISMQDEAVLDPQFAEILRRVRDNADFMPDYQLDQQMTANLGAGWEAKFKDFDMVPFAAASLGQVHTAILHDGTKAVVKVQYPGVATSINSDIDNFTSLLGIMNVVPKGVYIEETMAVAKEELALETDYLLEAQSQLEMKQFLMDDPDFYVPDVYPELSGATVLTQEFVNGEAIDSFTDAPIEIRNSIGLKMLKLCLRELFEFRFMQTDPNWSNFFYDVETDKIKLLDFGASLHLTDEFTSEYLKVIRSCATGDRETIIASSIKMGFLTGYESDVMLDAHCDAIGVVGEPFATDADYDFVEKNASLRVGKLLEVFAKHRLTAPPRESYALNRKLSGAFLSCNKLKCVIPCKPLFDTVYNHRTGEDIIGE